MFGPSKGWLVEEWLNGRLGELWPQIVNYATGMVQPWRLIQLGLLVAMVVAAHLGLKLAVPRLEAWMRRRELSMTQARALILFRQRLRLILFVALAWATVLVMREVTWPSRSFLIAQAASLATAWLVVSFTSRIMRNPLLRGFVAITIWTVAALSIFGLYDQTIALLESAAIDFGETRFSLLILIQAALVLTLTITFAGWISRFVARQLQRSTDISPSMRVLSEKLIGLALYGVAIVMALQAIGFDLTSLTIFSGAVGLGLGFGLQKVVSNLVSGIILLMDRSIKPGDVISLGETFGWITQLGARYVSVVTRDGREYLIPNEDLITGQVVNWSHSSDLVRLDIYFGVSYESDPHAVRKLASDAAASAGRVVSDPRPVCHIVGFGDSAIDFILRFWIRDPTGGLTNVRGNVYLALWDALKANGVEIPYPRRDVTIRKEAGG